MLNTKAFSPTAVLLAPNTIEISDKELCENIGIKLNAPKKESENTKNKETTNTMNSILADIENGKKVQVFDYSSLSKEEADELFEEIGGKDNVVFVETTNEEFEAIKNVENIETYKIEGYPTIKLVKDNQVIDFDAKPTKDTLTKFLNTVL